MEPHVYSPEAAINYKASQGFTMKRGHGSIFKQRILRDVLLYSECDHKAKSAARLYRERFPEGHHPSCRTIRIAVTRLRRRAVRLVDPQPADHTK
ncbi:hypothetical protein AVEN_99019-1 [Araneus ventricosus]|uniref:DUF4817 domain-containing protein n=1 Tax=Araneus ventricosus TaxID=182803 RepID=A0A4Y2G740_ARAVE|nr:hypothetical protein AVEN_99019-1 [Araneus ventricosus]